MSGRDAGVARRTFSGAVPTDCWYVLADSASVGDGPLAVRAVGLPVVLYRTRDGRAVALEDRCAHRAYPLSAGAVIDDGLRCGLCGWVYDVDGQCISVPTQPRVPFGAHVASYPVREQDGLVWAWLGERGRARLHRVPELPWLDDPGWATVGGRSEIEAGFLLLHENFADVTQVPFVAPEITPEALTAAPPPLDVVVTETTVALRRQFPPALLPAWQAELVGRVDRLGTVQEASFLSPAAWVDHWDAVDDGASVARLRFGQLVTPVDQRSSVLHWRVARDFALTDAAADARLQEIFADYYSRVAAAMTTAQGVLDLDGPGPEVNVAADVAALRVRDIVLALLSEEGTDGDLRR